METTTQTFSCEFCVIFKNTFFTEHLWMSALMSFANNYYCNLHLPNKDLYLEYGSHCNKWSICSKWVEETQQKLTKIFICDSDNYKFHKISISLANHQLLNFYVTVSVVSRYIRDLLKALKNNHP